MTEAEVYAQLTEIFRDAFSSPSLTLDPNMSANDVEGWDSLKMVNILLAVQDRFGIRLRSREVDSLQTVDDLAGLIRAKTGE